MSEETLKIVVPVFTAVVTAFVTYYLTRSHYDRKRKDDLADREFSRRAAVYDMRIKEARDFIDVLNALTDVYQTFIIGAIYFLVDKDNKEKNLEALMEDVDKSFESSPLDKDKIVRESSLKLLDDETLLDLYGQARKIMFSELKKWAILDKLKVEGEIDKSVIEDIHILSNAVNRIDSLITKMKKRLDELSSELK